jgi:hypothetical protein
MAIESTGMEKFDAIDKLTFGCADVALGKNCHNIECIKAFFK